MSEDQQTLANGGHPIAGGRLPPAAGRLPVGRLAGSQEGRERGLGRHQGAPCAGEGASRPEWEGEGRVAGGWAQEKEGPFCEERALVGTVKLTEHKDFGSGSESDVTFLTQPRK